MNVIVLICILKRISSNKSVTLKKIVVTGLIYMVGGCSESVRFLQDLMSYNPKTKVWRTLAPMSIARSQMGVAVIDDYLYVVGGNCKDQVLDSVERYSFKKVSINWFYSFDPFLILRSRLMQFRHVTSDRKLF